MVARHEEKICVNPDCSRQYIPNSGNQKYCGLEICRKYRNNRIQTEWNKTATGRKCLWCKRSDSATIFRTKNECSACRSRAQLNGRCWNKSCRGRPRFKWHRGAYYCEPCEGRHLRKGSRIEIRLRFDRGMYRFVWKSPEYKIQLENTRVKLGALRKKMKKRLTFLVSVSDYDKGIAKRPLAVWEVTEPVWPRDLVFLSERHFYQLYELAHFIRLGEAWPLTFTWWWGRFYEDYSYDTALRAWERLKKELRDLGMCIETGGEKQGTIHLDKRSFVEGMDTFNAQYVA